MTFSQEKLIQTFHFESHYIGFRLKNRIARIRQQKLRLKG